MIYFIIYLFLEVLISVNISSYIGSMMTFFEIILSAFFGILILVNFRNSLRENLTAVSYSCIDLEQFQSLNLFTIVGAMLLIIPGFLTDTIGVLLQFSVFSTMVVNRFSMNRKNCDTSFKKNNIKKDSDVIDVEIVHDNSFIK